MIHIADTQKPKIEVSGEKFRDEDFHPFKTVTYTFDALRPHDLLLGMSLAGIKDLEAEYIELLTIEFRNNLKKAAREVLWVSEGEEPVSEALR